MSVAEYTPVAARLQANLRARATGRMLAVVTCCAALLTALACVTWLVLAAAARPSVLSATAERGHSTWVLGPLHGVLHAVARNPHTLHTDLAVAIGVMGAAWLVAWIAAPAVPTWLIVGVLAVAHLLLFLGPPQPLTDIFNYLLYGRMAAHGLNPYLQLPLVARNDPAFILSNWHHLKSPYGPLQTLLTQGLAPLSLHTAYWAWKAIVIGSSAATLGIIWWLARELGRSPQRALVCVGLCPVVLAIGVGGFHNDSPAELCLLAAVACLVRGRQAGTGDRWAVAAGALAVAAAGLKPSFALAVPLVVLGARARLPAIAGAAWACAAVALVTWLVYGGALPDIAVQGALVSPSSIPNLAGLAAGHGGADAAVRGFAQHAVIAVAVVATVVVARRRDLALSAVGIVLLATLFSLAWIVPWYLAWALPFIALGRPAHFAPLVVVAVAWLGVSGLPVLPSVLHQFGYYPTRLATGEANHSRLMVLVR